MKLDSGKNLSLLNNVSCSSLTSTGAISCSSITSTGSISCTSFTSSGITNNTNEIVQGLFELKFLLIFTKCTNLCNQVTLFLKNDYPIILTYQIASLGEIKLVLSPSKSD